jgi:hypothetical protein
MWLRGVVAQERVPLLRPRQPHTHLGLQHDRQRLRASRSMSPFVQLAFSLRVPEIASRIVVAAKRSFASNDVLSIGKKRDPNGGAR